MLLVWHSVVGKRHWQSSPWPSEVQYLLEQEDVKLITFDQCMFGLVSKETKTPMQKRTCILTNVPEIVSALDGKFCDGSHPHQRIEGSEGGCKRSVWAQHYPDQMVDTLCKAVLRCQKRCFD